MPLYEFKCNDCNETFSELRKLGDDRDVPCQQCGSANTKKLVSTFSSRIAGKSAHTCTPSGG